MAKGTKVQVKTSDSLPVENITDQDTLDSMLKKASITFEGHPADEPEEEEEEETKTGGPEKKEDKTEPPAKDTKVELSKESLSKDTPPKKPSEEGNDGKTPEEMLAEAQKEIETLNKRFTDTQRDFHTTREENKRQREQNEKLSSQLQDLLVAINKQKVEAPAAPKKDPMEEIDEAVGRTLDEIENLDPASADYRAKSVKAWGGVMGKLKSLIDQSFEERISATRSELQKERDEQRRKDEEARSEADRTSQVNSHADSKATESGLDMRTNIESTDESGKKSKVNSADYDMFWRFAGYAPGETTDEKIEWTINEVKRMKALIGQPIVQAKEKAVKTQKNNSVLEKGGSRPPETVQTEKPMTMDEALGKAQRTF